MIQTHQNQFVYFIPLFLTTENEIDFIVNIDYYIGSSNFFIPYHILKEGAKGIEKEKIDKQDTTTLLSWITTILNMIAVKH